MREVERLTKDGVDISKCSLQTVKADDIIDDHQEENWANLPEERLKDLFVTLMPNRVLPADKGELITIMKRFMVTQGSMTDA